MSARKAMHVGDAHGVVDARTVLQELHAGREETECGYHKHAAESERGTHLRELARQVRTADRCCNSAQTCPAIGTREQGEHGMLPKHEFAQGFSVAGGAWYKLPAMDGGWSV